VLSRRSYLSIFDMSHKLFRSLWKSASQNPNTGRVQSRDKNAYLFADGHPCRVDWQLYPSSAGLWKAHSSASSPACHLFRTTDSIAEGVLPPLQLFLQHQGFCLPSLCICDSFSSVPKFLSASLFYDSIFKAEIDESNIKLKKNIRKGSR